MGIGWLLVSGLLIAWLQSLLLGRWALHKITYSRQFNVRDCYVGDQIELVETIANSKALPVPWIRMESMIPSYFRFAQQDNLDISTGDLFQNHKSLFVMMPYTRITRIHKIRCERRGVYALDTVAMTGGDFLGIISSTRTLKVDARIVVFPQLVPIEDIPLPAQSWQGDIVVRRWILEDPFLSAGIRDYAYGDTMNRIHWKATAKANKLQVHKKDYTADFRLMIYLNVEVSKEMWNTVTDPALIEEGISYAASIAEELISRGMEVGFGHNAHSVSKPAEMVRIEPQAGIHHLTTMLHAMAEIEMRLREPFDFYLKDDVEADLPRTDYLIITAHVSETASVQMSMLEQQGHRIEVLPLTKQEKKAARKEVVG